MKSENQKTENETIQEKTCQTCRLLGGEPNENGEMMATFEIDYRHWEPKEVNMEKKDKPRLAEVLGVEVGERFKIPGYGAFYIDEFGTIIDCEGEELQPEDLAECINHPEIIIRAPRLREAELEICKAVGAKWVKRVGGVGGDQVVLWSENPESVAFGDGQDNIWLGRVRSELFPSVKPGDCIEVED